MKVGILTFHAAHNYGAVLQCYALSEYLKSLGHDVYVVDYRLKYLLKCYNWFNLSNLKKSIIHGYLIKELKTMMLKRKRGETFKRFVSKYFRLADVSLLENDFFDYVVIGSDQVWNTKLTNGFDRLYWGQFKHSSHTKIISYAASLEGLWDKEYDDKIKNLFSSFSMISTREYDVACRIKNILQNSKIVTTCVDPTLLITDLQWNKIVDDCPIKEKYVLYYQVKQSKIGMDISRRISCKYNCKLYVLSANLNLENSPEVVIASPEKMLGLIKNAEFVVNSSFHGTVFSVIFKKNFISISSGGKDSRVKNLLTNLNLMEHYIEGDFEDREYKTQNLKEILSKYVMSSVEYLNLIR